MLKHCTGALSPSMSQFACSTIPADQRSGDAKDDADADVKEEVGAEPPHQPHAPSLHPFGGSPSVSVIHPESLEAAGRAASALHALSFMSPMAGAYGLISAPPSAASVTASSCASAQAPFLPPGLQSIYANPSKYRLLMSDFA